MSSARYARVVPDRSGQSAFDYEIPEPLMDRIGIGSRVRVPVRTRLVLATVVELLDATEFDGVKPIAEALSAKPLINPLLIRLGHWIASYYCCPLHVALRAILPQVVRNAEVKEKRLLFASLAQRPDAAALEALTRRAPKQAGVIDYLMGVSEPVAVTDLMKECGVTRATLDQLRDRGLIALERQAVQRDPYAEEVFLHAPQLEMNAEQAAAFERISAAVRDPAAYKPVLLHGVTGSGKTELYLRAIDLALGLGKTAIVLVPEISLTPQTVERFKSRFAHFQTEVAVLHSHLSDGERHDEWHKINNGAARIVIGARSAVFAPIERLGLIVVDEEHENSYKQEEAPRYHARDVAVYRALIEGCAIVLGSATPSMESYQNATIGKYELVQLQNRVDERQMPHIRIIDLRMEGSRGPGASILSEALSKAIRARLEKKEQSILFLNRRGFSTSLICSSCGHVCECPNCSVSLTFHRATSRLVCHICGHIAVVPSKCPSCGDPRIRYSGAGTEKVEELVAAFFPDAVVKRLDADSISRKDSLREALSAFRTGKIDILVGTQMIAKGLHFPNVTLVGIVNADLGLHLPDFRGGERTFQLLTQVAGRAGRGEVSGEVFVQTYTPFHPAIQFARHHDFHGFWEQEVEFRRQTKLPPFWHVVLVTLRSSSESHAAFSADTLARRVREALGDGRLPADTVVSNPCPAPIEKSHGQYRFHLMIRTRRITQLSKGLHEIMEKLTFPEEVLVAVDVDAYQLL
ncbi:MAG TPA: primosomal protein N' [Chthoniobacteraceae bacterium]|jgi:primosomal protein N' (replication factor Y)|nr:primosomal protein N' [Chthoniobacteraceae bacterium]